MKKYANMLEFYRRLLGQNRVALRITVFLYVVIIVWFATFRIMQTNKQTLLYNNRAEIMLLTKELERTQKIVDSLIVGHKTPIFKPISFEENWDNDSNETEIRRIFEYAKFAMSKNDYKRAASLYKETQSIQNTYEAEYSLGLINYLEKDIESCIQTWKQLVDKDKDEQFPIVRFYLAMVLYEAGRQDESTKYLRNYVNTSQR